MIKMHSQNFEDMEQGIAEAKVKIAIVKVALEHVQREAETLTIQFALEHIGKALIGKVDEELAYITDKFEEIKSDVEGSSQL